MDDQHILKDVAPCGLDCGRCLSNPASPIGRLARELRAELGGFAARAERFAGYDPVFEAYPAFGRLLDRFAQGGGCQGCRQGGQCLSAACNVPACTRERGVDFCFQCPDFPCDRSGLNPGLWQVWIERNTRLQEQGPTAFRQWLDKQPRY